MHAYIHTYFHKSIYSLHIHYILKYINETTQIILSRWLFHCKDPKNWPTKCIPDHDSLSVAAMKKLLSIYHGAIKPMENAYKYNEMRQHQVSGRLLLPST